MARILIAEDSPDIRALIQMLLEADGHEVSSAVTDGRAAVEAARNGSARPDPDGPVAAAALRAGRRRAQIRTDPDGVQIPILAVTAHAMHGDRERALAAGCDGFIAKPINEETFASRVSRLLERAARPFRGAGPRDRAELRSRAGPDPRRRRSAGGRGSHPRRPRGRRSRRGVATSAAAAVARVAMNEPYDLAVIDVMLGADSGYDADSERSRSGSPDYVPILLVTAGTIDRERGFAAGADDFIGKPIDTMELRARARSLIRVGRAMREQRRVGRERSEAYRKLEELDRLKSDFLSTVSHELRTPLNTIILLAHQLEKAAGGATTRSGRRATSRILRGAAETLRQMIDNILDLAKLEAGQQRPASAGRRRRASCCTSAPNLLEPQAREKGSTSRVESIPLCRRSLDLDRGKGSQGPRQSPLQRRQVHGAPAGSSSRRGPGRARSPSRCGTPAPAFPRI